MMTDKELKDWCKTCSVEPPAMKFKCPECEHNPDKEQIIIDGIQFNKFGDFYVDYNLNGKFQSISSSAKEYKILKSLIEQLARKTQECEELEDFRTLVRELFTFGDSDVDDEHFIKYLKEDCKSSQEALDGYCRLTDITGIDYTVHGGADIEEIVKRVDSLKHECEELKETLNNLTRGVVMPVSEPEVIDLTDRYRKALEEIEDYCNSKIKSDFDFIEAYTPILNIINKAKGGEDEKI